MSKILTLTEIITQAQRLRASDIHIVCGIPIRTRVDGKLHNLDTNVMTAEDCESYARDLSNHYEDISIIGEQDLAVGFPDGTRCRVNLFRQQGTVSAAIRILNSHIPAFEELGLPANIANFTEFNQGIVLVTGETGSGKSTTLAAMLDSINHTQRAHIVTLEDPVEYIYKPDLCAINQREIGKDTRSFSDGLRASLREDPNVILIGEMRDRDTIETAITAAETGHLVFGTLHTGSASDAVDRMVQVFPEGMQTQIRLQLSMVLQAVLTQQLLPKKLGGRVLACEFMLVTDAIRNLIRSGNTPQIANAIATSAALGGQTMDQALSKLSRSGTVAKDVAMHYAHDPSYVKKNG